MAFWNAHRITGRKSNGFGGPLRLEYLEDRNGPSLLVGYPDVATTGLMSQKDETPTAPMEYSPPADTEPVVGEPANQPPKVIDFTATLDDGMWTFTGTVSDENPAGLKVTFGGSFAPMNGQTAVTNANGQFTITVPADGSGGRVSAGTADAQGLASNTAYCTI